MPEPLIALEHVSKSFALKNGSVHALDDVSIRVGEREVVCLVGESGSGKTTAGKVMAGLLFPTSGLVTFRGRDTRSLRGRDWKKYRLGVQMIHQDPFASLNPTQRVEDILGAPLRRHRLVSDRRALRARVSELLASVGLTPPEDIRGKFPHQLSGGQRQRVSIARALTVAPAVLIADEAVSMVDVSIRISLLDTLRELREQVGLGVLFITHDLALARYFARDAQIAVMYRGKVVEAGMAGDLIDNPRHAYTQALVAAAPTGLERLAPWPIKDLLGRSVVAEPGADGRRRQFTAGLPTDASLPMSFPHGAGNGDPAALLTSQVEGSGTGTRATKGGPNRE